MQIDNDSYSYQQLYSLIKSNIYKYTNNFKNIFTVRKDSPINFIIDFLTIIESGNYPLIIDSYIKESAINLHNIADETLFLASTSGTTGQPKIYSRDWLSWKSGFEVCNDLFHLKNLKSLVTSSPLTTSLGLHTLMCSLYLGKTFIPITEPSQLSALNETCALFTVPTYLIKNIEYIHSLHSINTLFLGGGTLEIEIINQLKKQLTFTKIIEFYGSSETSFISYQRVDNGKIPYSVGKLFPNTHIRIEKNQRMWVKSPYLFSGYVTQSKPESWLTDDLGMLKNNVLYLLGRHSDIIEHGANKIFPQEIEQMAKDLCETCIAFGISDKKYGQNIALLLIKPIEKEHLLKTLSQRLPKYKLPKVYLKTESLTLTDNYKISRKTLEQNYFRGDYHEF